LFFLFFSAVRTALKNKKTTPVHWDRGKGELLNGHDRRREKIAERIKQSALKLFTQFGADQVSMDEIAADAQVSKVTIYKYFQSKEALHREVLDLYVDDILDQTEKALNSELDFGEKLKFTQVAKLDAPKMAGGQSLFELLELYGQTGDERQACLKERIKAIMFKFYEQGKKEGYIEEGMPFELLYLFSEIVEAGFKAKAKELEPIAADPVAFDQLLHLYYFGIFKSH
jgi:AcrR family transcriptional regulator